MRLDSTTDNADDREPLRALRDLAGTPVQDADAHHIGEVYGSLTEARSGLIRFLDLAISRTGKHVLVPIGHTRVERKPVDRANVRLRAAALDDLEGIPVFEPDLTAMDDPYLDDVMDAHSRLFHGERYYAHPAFDHGGLFAGEHPILREQPQDEPERPLTLLSDLPNYRIAEDESDIRGWPLLEVNGETLGRIADFIVDTEARKARYAVVDLAQASGAVLLPVGYLEVDAAARRVVVGAFRADDLTELPRYEGGAVMRPQEELLRLAIDKRLGGARRFARADFRHDASLSDALPD